MGIPNVTPIRHGHAYNESTGEVYPVEVEAEAQAAKRRRKKRGDRHVFSLLDNNAMARLDVTGLGYRLVMQLLRETNLETGIARITGAELAEALNSHQPSIARAMKELLDRNIVIKVGSGRYRVNAHLAWRGDLNDWDDQTDKDPEPIYERVGATSG